MLAVAQPGDIGGQDTAAPAETTSTTAGSDLTTSTTVAVTTTIAPTTTTLPASETTTTIGGSGLNVSGPASGGTDGTAKTGGESMLGAGLGLLGLGLALRRATRLSAS